MFRLIGAGMLLLLFGSGVVSGMMTGRILGRLDGHPTARTDFLLSGMGSLVGLALIVFTARSSRDPVSLIQDTWVMCPLVATSVVLFQHVSARLIRR